MKSNDQQLYKAHCTLSTRCIRANITSKKTLNTIRRKLDTWLTQPCRQLFSSSLLGLVTTKPALGISDNCLGLSINLRACTNVLLENDLIPTLACCQTLGQIQTLESSIGINRTCVCVQGAVAEIVPARIIADIPLQVLAACGVNLAFNVTASPMAVTLKKTRHIPYPQEYELLWSCLY